VDSFGEPLWTDSAAFANTGGRKEKDGCISRLFVDSKDVKSDVE
jgi:hypothetical protein